MQIIGPQRIRRNARCRSAAVCHYYQRFLMRRIDVGFVPLAAQSLRESWGRQVSRILSRIVACEREEADRRDEEIFQDQDE